MSGIGQKLKDVLNIGSDKAERNTTPGTTTATGTHAYVHPDPSFTAAGATADTGRPVSYHQAPGTPSTGAIHGGQQQGLATGGARHPPLGVGAAAQGGGVGAGALGGGAAGLETHGQGVRSAERDLRRHPGDVEGVVPTGDVKVDRHRPHTTTEDVATAGGRRAEVVTTTQQTVLTPEVKEREAERKRGDVCGTTTFTEVEDRPVVVERVIREVVHRPVEKTYEVETRAVGERQLRTETQVVDTKERVVDEVAGSKCPTTLPTGGAAGVVGEHGVHTHTTKAEERFAAQAPAGTGTNVHTTRRV